MKQNFRTLLWPGLGMFLVMTLACGFLGSPPTATPLPPTRTIAPTNTPPPSPTKTTPTKATNATNTAQCTTLQDLNLRTGPGLAYRNPIGVVLEGTVVEPVGYVPDGIPSGSWIMIETGDENQSGWITAGETFLTCAIDLDSLPTVDVVPPPPPPLPKTAQTSDPEGGCGPNEEYQCEVIITDESFLQFKIFRNGVELTENDNIVQVSFSVRQGGKDDNGAEVYSVVEGVAAYCILGGNGPCNNWPLENNVTVWPDGPAVLPGTYFVEIFATVDENGSENNVRWAAEFDVTLP
ncbi:MAG: hypothetical protein JW963_05860 [Anaerolineales bacterium]|nr:hypothetical protein [Anaerolineales bacterium]